MNSISINDKTHRVMKNIKEKGLIPADAKGVLIIKDCILIQQFTGKTYTYRAMNFRNGKQQYLFHRKEPLSSDDHDRVTEKIKKLDIFNDDYPGDALAMVDHIFRKVFTSYGYAIREEQIALSKHMCATIDKRKISLSDIPVGLGKTHAYLVAAIAHRLYQKGGINKTAKPMIITTSSIELQRAIIKEYIPEISKMLMDHGIITKSLTCVLRKGKDNYLCDRRLKDYVATLDPTRKKIDEYIVLNELIDRHEIDLDEIKGISNYDKRRICVHTNNCMTCKKQNECRYQKYMRQAKKLGYDFQVCNHNYFLADVLRRKKNLSGLLPNYDNVIIDEAHKLKSAASQMYGASVSQNEVDRLLRKALPRNNKSKKQARIREACYEAMSNNQALFKELKEQIPRHISKEDTEKFPTLITRKARIYLNKVISNLESIFGLLPSIDRRLIADIKRMIQQMKVFNQSSIIYWIEKPFSKGEAILAAIPIMLSKELGCDLWTDGKAMLLTSGTIAVDGDFSYIRNEIGIEHMDHRVEELTKQSPFDFKANCLIYLSEQVSHPSYDSEQYMRKLTDELEKLIRASNGHALVLFTSYKLLRQVSKALSERIKDIPLFQMKRGRSDVIEKFKKSGDGVLFGTGSIWEGINIPGDILSHLIIVKLPFDVPNPISDYEKTCYSHFDDYMASVLLPKMLIKLKQGAGRLIRKESDSGCISILDSRAGSNGRYHQAVLKALPECKVTSEVDDIEIFMREKKDQSYFKK